MIVASRTLTLRQPYGDLPVLVTILQPREERGAWACDYHIGWPDDARTFTIYGHDSAQALLLTMQAIGVDLYASDEHQEGRLFLHEGRIGYGFPVTTEMRHLLRGDDARFL